jgi:hypothetical protein
MERREFIVGAASLMVAGPASASIDATLLTDERSRYPNYDWAQYDRWIEWLRKEPVYLIRQPDGAYRVEHPMVLNWLLNPHVPVGITSEDDRPVKQPCMSNRYVPLPTGLFLMVSNRDAFELLMHPKLANNVRHWSLTKPWPEG